MNKVLNHIFPKPATKQRIYFQSYVKTFIPFFIVLAVSSVISVMGDIYSSYILLLTLHISLVLVLFLFRVFYILPKDSNHDIFHQKHVYEKMRKKLQIENKFNLLDIEQYLEEMENMKQKIRLYHFNKWEFLNFAIPALQKIKQELKIKH